MSNHYETLNVTRDAEDVVIDSAYRALMKRYHPDKTRGDAVAAERTKLINAAYATLRDPQSRASYDRTLDAATANVVERHQPKRAEPPPPAATSTSPRHPSRGLGAPFFFSGLALVIGVGAIGSLMQGGSPGPVSTVAPPLTVDAGDVPPVGAERADEQQIHAPTADGMTSSGQADEPLPPTPYDASIADDTQALDEAAPPAPPPETVETDRPSEDLEGLY